MQYAKAYAALVGSICTALLGIYGPETEVGQWLTIAVAVLSAVATYAVPNKDPKGRHQSESVMPPGA